MILRYTVRLFRHKWFVFLEACKLGIPFLGIIHDASKFLPDEFFAYARSFYGGLRAEVKPEFDAAWNHHQKRNKHHWQYWLLVNDEDGVYPLPVPDVYRREMLADWRGAGRAYGNPDTPGWYAKNRDKIILHPSTRQWVEAQFTIKDENI